MVDTQSKIVPCGQCGRKNRIASDKTGIAARCGHCGSSLDMTRGKTDAAPSYLIRCAACGTRNRVPSHRIKAGPKCGKCGAVLATEPLFAGKPVIITDKNFETEVLQFPLPVLLFAWAPWCATCKTFIPVVEDFAGDARGKVRVGKLNVDDNPLLASKFDILSVPFAFIFDNGRLKESMPGAMHKHEIMMKMAPYL
ncbi:MAG: thioredoxin domain-containing protein [Desulfobacterales bacterium]|nr:thioredoxin domain-containing protein [Desulfobacterales bacterium]